MEQLSVLLNALSALLVAPFIKDISTYEQGDHIIYYLPQDTLESKKEC